MVNKLIPILLFLLVQSVCWAQRPLGIDALEPKVDSVKTEANLIFQRIKIHEVLTEKANELNIDTFYVIIYNKNQSDTIVGLLTDANDEYIFEQHFKTLAQNSIYQNQAQRKLTKEELSLLKLKQTFQKESKKAKYDIELRENCYSESFLLPMEQGYKFYVLSLSNQDSTIHFGNDYVFIFNDSARLKSWRELTEYNKISVKIKDQGPNSTGQIETLFLIGDQSDQLPEAIDIAKFRMYHHNIRLDKFKHICNKRWFTYNAIKNEVSIKPFPNEQK